MSKTKNGRNNQKSIFFYLQELNAKIADKTVHNNITIWSVQYAESLELRPDSTACKLPMKFKIWTSFVIGWIKVWVSFIFPFIGSNFMGSLHVVLTKPTVNNHFNGRWGEMKAMPFVLPPIKSVMVWIPGRTNSQALKRIYEKVLLFL